MSLCYTAAKMGEQQTRELGEAYVAQSLVLDHLDPDPTVARRLSPSLAFRHRALPVAEADHCVTVAMADPSDTAAREAVAVALEAEPCVVQSDPAAIAIHLSRIWPQGDQSPPNLLAYVPTGPCAEEVKLYAENVGHLLSACLDYVPGECALHTVIETASHGYELVICGEPDQSFIDRLLQGALGRGALDRLPTSLLFVRRPRWPLRRLLLVVQGEVSDDSATDWALRLAGSRATVTVLAVVPPLPAMYHGLSSLEGGLAELLTADTALGRQMRRVARQLVDRNIEGKLRLRQGAPVWEIRREAVEGGHDLVAVSAGPQGGLRRLLLGELALSLLRVIDRPVLIAR